jgi:HAD superfamily hydrolase (TIGR01509 family)
MRQPVFAPQPVGSAAVIWDVDGTLVDSLECHWQSCREALAERDYVLTRDRFESIIGQKMDTALRSLLGADLALTAIEEIEATKETRCRELMQAGGIRPMPGVLEWLNTLRQAGWHQAVASSAPRLNLDVMLGALDLSEYFEAVVCAEDVRNGKPDPEPFLSAAARMGIAPVRCIVVEDAAPGIEGARKAGMRTIGVGPQHTLLRADVTVPTLDQLPADTFKALLGRFDG